MRIVCLGGGPAGLYFSILLKRANPAHDIQLFERHPATVTHGWGMVFSEATLATLAAADPATHVRLQAAMRHWDECVVHVKGCMISSGGHRFSGISRQQLLTILIEEAQSLGVRMHFEHPLDLAPETDLPAELRDADLIVGADGVGSHLRKRYQAQFQPSSELRKCRYIWLGSRLRLQAFSFFIVPSPWGWFQAHAYPIDETTSTFIIECREETWRLAGLDQMDSAASLAFCERLFAEHLQGQPLLASVNVQKQASWLNFNRLLCANWQFENCVLIGDAAHTLHFSIGSGVKLALEDASSLSRHVSAARDATDLPPILLAYQNERRQAVLRLQHAARNRMEWFENVARYVHLAPEQFAYALITSSQRISHENLRQRDPSYIAGLERWLAEQAAHQAGLRDTPGMPAAPPMFTPFRLRGLTLSNRIVVSPMCTYSCTDGVVNDFHLVHLGSRAMGGAGLIMTEMTAISADGRITPGCAGLWNDGQLKAWQRIVDFVHQTPTARIGIQLGHAGPKGSTQLGWQRSDEPLLQDNWPLIAASSLPYGPQNQVPRMMTHEDMERVRNDFLAATQRAIAAGFDLLELHCAHGYLLSSFISPLTNQRQDEYGGSLENRLRFPLEVCRQMRLIWPQDRPMAVRISAHDWAAGGLTDREAVEIARAFRDAGVDLIDVSSGQTTRAAQPDYGRMYQTAFADRIRNEAGIATLAVGEIQDFDQVNTIIASGRADLCALGRPHLADPAWTLHAAAAQGYKDMAWPLPYLAGKSQLERLQAAQTPG